MDNLPKTPASNNKDVFQPLNSLVNKTEQTAPQNENQFNEPLFEPQEKNEKIISQEKLTPTEQPSKEQTSSSLIENSNQPTTPSQPKVIDQTEKITSLHNVDPSADNLTKRADDEENKFITEVIGDKQNNK